MDSKKSENKNPVNKWIIILTVLLCASLAANIILAVNLRSAGKNEPVRTSDTGNTDTSDIAESTIDPGNVTINVPEYTGQSVIGTELSTEDCFPVQTAYCTFYLPLEYQDKIVAEDLGFDVNFYGIIDGEKYQIYSVRFGSSYDGVYLGTVNDSDGNELGVYVIYYEEYDEFYSSWDQDKKDEYDGMTETFNVLMNRFNAGAR